METYLPYTKALNELLKKYDEESQKDSMIFEDCGGGFCTEALPAEMNTACQQCLTSQIARACGFYVIAIEMNPFLLQMSQQSTRTEGTWRAIWASGGPAVSLGTCWDPALVLKIPSLVSRKASPA